MRQPLASSLHDNDGLIIHLPEDAPQLWPWATAWSAVLVETGRSRDGHGTRFRATGLGAVMRVREGLLGVGPTEYHGTAAMRDIRSMEAIADVWRQDSTGAAQADAVIRSMEVIAATIEEQPDRRRSSGYHEAVTEAIETAKALERAGADMPNWEAWRRLRAVASGALPMPSAAEKAATRVRMAKTGVAQASTHGRDCERLSAMRRAAREVAAAARVACRTLTDSAVAWRQLNCPAWTGGRPNGDHPDSADSACGTDDDSASERGSDSQEEGPTDDEDDRQASAAQGAGAVSARGETSLSSQDAVQQTGGCSGHMNKPVGQTCANSIGAGPESSRAGKKPERSLQGSARTAADRSGRLGNTVGLPMARRAGIDAGRGDALPQLQSVAYGPIVPAGVTSPSVLVTVAGSRRAATADTGCGAGVRHVTILRSASATLCNPFVMPSTGRQLQEHLRGDVCAAHAEWLRLRDVPAREVVGGPGGRRPRILREYGSMFPPAIAPQRRHGELTGDMARAAIQKELNANAKAGERLAHTIRLQCSRECGEGRDCHGDNLAAIAREMIAVHDAAKAAAAPAKVRATRKDKGIKRGPRAIKGHNADRIGIVSLYRYRYGMEREVSQRTREAVVAAERRGVHPWLLYDDRERPPLAIQQPTEDADGTGEDNYNERVCAECCDTESRDRGADAEHGWMLDESEEPAQTGEGDGHECGNAVTTSCGEMCSPRRWSYAASAVAVPRRKRSALRSRLQKRLELDVSEGPMDVRGEETDIVSGVPGRVDNLEGAAGDSADGAEPEDTGLASRAASGAIVRSTDKPEPREALAASTPPRAAATDEQKSPRSGPGTRKRARKAMNAAAWRAAQAKEAG